VQPRSMRLACSTHYHSARCLQAALAVDPYLGHCGRAIRLAGDRSICSKTEPPSHDSVDYYRFR
jgi:hypothetical protein